MLGKCIFNSYSVFCVFLQGLSIACQLAIPTFLPSTWGGAGSLFGILFLQIGGIGFIGTIYLTRSNVSKTIFGIW